MTASTPRRRLPLRALDKAAARILSDAARAAADAALPDALLLAACARYGGVWHRINRLFLEPDRVRDEARRARAHMALLREGRPILAEVVATPATTLIGHAARAAVVWTEGDLAVRVRHGRRPEDVLLAALVRDLIHGR